MDADIVASRAQFPKSVYDTYGATLCMGFIYVRSTNSTKYLWKKFYKAMEIIQRADDQDILNKLIFINGRINFPNQKISLDREIVSRKSNGNGYFWNFTYNSHVPRDLRKIKPLDFENSFEPDIGFFSYRHQRAKLSLLPHSTFQRICEIDLGSGSSSGSSSSNSGDRTSLSTSMEAIVAHCHGPKRGFDKELVFRHHMIWLLNNSYANPAKLMSSDDTKKKKHLENFLASIFSKQLYDLFISSQHAYAAKYVHV